MQAFLSAVPYHYSLVHPSLILLPCLCRVHSAIFVGISSVLLQRRFTFTVGLKIRNNTILVNSNPTLPPLRIWLWS